MIVVQGRRLQHHPSVAAARREKNALWDAFDGAGVVCQETGWRSTAIAIAAVVVIQLCQLGGGGGAIDIFEREGARRDWGANCDGECSSLDFATSAWAKRGRDKGTALGNSLLEQGVFELLRIEVVDPLGER